MTIKVKGINDTSDFGLRICPFEGANRYVIVNTQTGVEEYYPALLSGGIQALEVLQAELDAVRNDMGVDPGFNDRLDSLNTIQ